MTPVGKPIDEASFQQAWEKWQFDHDGETFLKTIWADSPYHLEWMPDGPMHASDGTHAEDTYHAAYLSYLDYFTPWSVL